MEEIIHFLQGEMEVPGVISWFHLFMHVRKNPQKESTTFKRKISPKVDEYVHKRTAHKSRIKDFEEKLVENKGHSFKPKVNKVSNNENATQTESGINKSSKNIQFESNDLLDEYKK